MSILALDLICTGAFALASVAPESIAFVAVILKLPMVFMSIRRIRNISTVIGCTIANSRQELIVLLFVRYDPCFLLVTGTLAAYQQDACTDDQDRTQTVEDAGPYATGVR